MPPSRPASPGLDNVIDFAGARERLQKERVAGITTPTWRQTAPPAIEYRIFFVFSDWPPDCPDMVGG